MSVAATELKPPAKRLEPSAFFENNEQRKEIPVPQLRGTVLVRSMSTLEQDEYEVKLALGEFKSGYRAWLAYHCVINDDGSLFFEKRDGDGKVIPKEQVMHELATKNPWGILGYIADEIAGISASTADLSEVKKSSDPGPGGAFSD